MKDAARRRQAWRARRERVVARTATITNAASKPYHDGFGSGGAACSVARPWSPAGRGPAKALMKRGPQSVPALVKDVLRSATPSKARATGRQDRFRVTSVELAGRGRSIGARSDIGAAAAGRISSRPNKVGRR